MTGASSLSDAAAILATGASSGSGAWRKATASRQTLRSSRTPVELVVRRDPEPPENLVELARLAEHPAQPLRQPVRAHSYHQERIARLNGARDQDVYLATLDDVAKTRTPVVITKRGQSVARLVSYLEPAKGRSLTGSVVKEVADPYGTGERWDADAS